VSGTPRLVGLAEQTPREESRLEGERAPDGTRTEGEQLGRDRRPRRIEIPPPGLHAHQTGRFAGTHQRADRRTSPGEDQGQVGDVVAEQGRGEPWIHDMGGEQDDRLALEGPQVVPLHEPHARAVCHDGVAHGASVLLVDGRGPMDEDGSCARCLGRPQCGSQPFQEPTDVRRRRARLRREGVHGALEQPPGQFVHDALLPGFGVFEQRHGVDTELERGRCAPHRGVRGIEAEHPPIVRAARVRLRTIHRERPRRRRVPRLGRGVVRPAADRPVRAPRRPPGARPRRAEALRWPRPSHPAAALRRGTGPRGVR